MAERKTLLREGTCAVVALPGGVGTLDELIETAALVHLKRYFGKMALLNHDGFYEPLKVLLDHYVATGMMPQSTRDMVLFADTPEELLDLLEE
jgi:predicted Rossmann-fold nucleotide-binding protein